MKKIATSILVMLISTVSVFAHGAETFAAAEEIIEQKIPCDDLNNEHFEGLGDYYMEQMHPGEAHIRMDEMMGGEGSAQLKAMHIQMAKSFYCGEHEGMSSGMMEMMMGRGMMGSLDTNTRGGMNMAYGMMGSGFGMGWYSLMYVALAAFVFGIVFWWTRTLVVKGKRIVNKR